LINDELTFTEKSEVIDSAEYGQKRLDSWSLC